MTPAKILVALTLVGGCTYNTHFDDCVVRCADDQACPEDLVCGAEGLCRAPGATEACVGGSNTHQSCTGLAATCGPNSDEDCCSTAQMIPGGTFYRSFDVAADGMYPDLSYPATVSAFKLDRFKVTVGRFRKFVEAGMGTMANPPATGAGAHTKILGSGWEASWNSALTDDLAAAVKCDATFQTWTDTPGANEDLPINCVTWYEAMAFCAWDSGVLPTEAEWNFAAAGGEEQRAYPWSSPAGATVIDCSYANYSGCGTFLTPVGSFPRSEGRWGQADLAGDVYEWTFDWFDSQYETPCTDCAALAITAHRTIRNSDHGSTASDLRAAHRNHFAPATPSPNIGARCARSAM